MVDSTSGKSAVTLSDEEYASNLTKLNAERLTACVEKLTDQVERLDDPAVFAVTLIRSKPGE